MPTVVWVVLAGAGGVLARYLIGTAVATDALPAATVAINVVGSFLLGFVVNTRLPHEIRVALAVGFLGGFTTFSTFALDVFLDVDAERGAEALIYLIASVGLGVVAAGLGYFAGRALMR